MLLERSLSAYTAANYIQNIEKFFDFIKKQHPDTSIQFISLSHVREYSQLLTGGGRSAFTHNTIMSSLSSFYKYLLFQNIVKNIPTELLDRPRAVRRIPEVLNIDEIDRLLNSFNLRTLCGLKDYAVFETLYSCGLRVSELCRLKMHDIDMEECYVRVIGKGNKERIVPIGRHALKSINIYRDRVRSKIRIRSGNEKYLFLNQQGRHLSRVSVFLQMKKYLSLAGIRKKAHPHTLRHSFASHLVENGADIRAVQEMMGHESIMATQIYVHFDKRYLRDTIERYLPNPFTSIKKSTKKQILRPVINILSTATV